MISQKRQNLVATAKRLFSQYGYHATGIDQIAEESRVSKKTLYHHFQSKDELILTVLKESDGEQRNAFMRAVENSGDNAYERLLGMFEVTRSNVSRPDFYGCMFINAICEYSDSDTPIRRASQEFKTLTRDYIKRLTQELDVARPDKLAAELAILLEGCLVTAQVMQDPSSADIARDAARALIERELAATADAGQAKPSSP